MRGGLLKMTLVVFENLCEPIQLTWRLQHVLEVAR